MKEESDTKIWTVSCSSYEVLKDVASDATYEDLAPLSAYRTREAAEQAGARYINEEIDDLKTGNAEDDEGLPPPIEVSELEWRECPRGSSLCWKHVDEYTMDVYVIVQIELEDWQMAIKPRIIVRKEGDRLVALFGPVVMTATLDGCVLEEETNVLPSYRFYKEMEAALKSAANR